MEKRKSTLRAEDFVLAGVEYVKSNGLSSMTMRALGDEMGVDPTALYRHFPNKESLIDGMIDWFLGRVLTESLAGSEGKSPRERILALALAMRRAFAEYPEIGVSLVSSEGTSRNGLELSIRSAHMLKELGLSGTALVRYYQAIEDFIMGSCVFDFAGSPHHIVVRRARYRLLELPDFDAESTTDASIVTGNEESFIVGINALLDACEHHGHR